MRSYRELWLWLGGLFLVLFPLPAAIAIAYYLKLTNYSVLLNRWMLASLLFFLAAFVCFFCAIKGLRMPPWKKIKFPDIKVHIYGEGFATVEHVITVPGGSGQLVTNETLKRYLVRIVNMEGEQNASLTIRLYAKLVPGSSGPVLDTVCPPPGWNLSLDLSLNQIKMPIVLEPGMAVGGDLFYVMTSFLKFAEPFSAHLELDDHVTGKRVRIPAHMGQFDRKAMVPSSGGLEIAPEPTLAPKWYPTPSEHIAGLFRDMFPH
jgi:hypothetical protein